MNRVILGLFLSLALPAAMSSASVPNLLNYQGRLTNPDGSPKPDGAYLMKFEFFDAETLGNKLPTNSPWSETQSVPVDSNGDFSVHLGKEEPLPSQPFFGAATDSRGPVVYLEVTVGGEPLEPRSRIGSAGFAVTTAVPNLSVRSVTTANTATSSDDVLMLSGSSFTQTLFSAAGNAGKVLSIQHAGTSITNSYTMATTGGQTIGGVASGAYALHTNGEALRIVSDGSNWAILEHKTETDWSAPTTMTLTASVSGQVTKGTTTSDSIQWKRVGSSCLVRFNYRQTTAGAMGSGNIKVAIPGGITADTSFSGAYAGTDPTVAMGFALDSQASGNIGTSAGTIGRCYLYDPTHFCVNSLRGATTYVIWGSAGDSTANTVMNQIGYLRFPVSGWKP